MALPCRSGVSGLAVAGAVRGDGGSHALRLPEQGRHLGRIVGVTLGQHVGCDLARASIHGQVELAPLPAQSAVLLGIPFALAGQFQARAVQRQVDWASAGQHTRLAPRERPTAPGQRRVVRNGQSQPEQAQHAAAGRLGLTQGQMEHEPQRQHEFDGQFGMQRPSARAAPLWRCPAREDRLVQSQREVATAAQPCLTRRPVRDAVARGMRWRRVALCLNGMEGK